MIDHIKDSISRAEMFDSKLTREILSLEGMCKGRVLHLLNNIVDTPNARYLEVGVYRGATFIAALYRNNYKRAIAIDNWSEPESSRDVFMRACKRHIGEYSLIDNHCFNVKLEEEINIYFYDGRHTEGDHVKALSHFRDSFSNEIIFIVDDYNWKQVAVGTRKAVSEWEVLYDRRLGEAESHETDTEWGAGLYIALLRK